jgi:hypothetical protein
MRFPEPNAIQTRRRELEAKIAEGERAKEELSKIDEWLKVGAELIPEVQQQDGAIRIRPAATKGDNPLSQYAETILAANGKLHVKLLMHEMRKIGWISTGDDRVDMKNVFASLSTNKRFENLGRNVWVLR